jgi:hypothetical protein
MTEAPEQQQQSPPEQGAPEAPAQQTPESQEGSAFDRLPPETQEEIRRLRRENARHRTAAQEANLKVKQYEDADKSELQRITDRATQAEQKANAAEARLLRYEVAASKKVPPEWVHRLVGGTREELEADADELLKSLRPDGREPAGGNPDFGAGARQAAPAGENDMSTLMRRAAGYQ